MTKPRTKKGRRKPETSGRPELPPELRKVSMSCRVPKWVRDGYDARAAAHGTDSRGIARSSRGIEIERAFTATQDQHQPQAPPIPLV